MEGERRIGLTGDVTLGRGAGGYAADRSPWDVWGGVHSRLCGLDALIVNLESPLTTRDGEWSASYRPYLFRATPGWARSVLSAAGVDVACLANDHALDYEVGGLRDTVAHLDRAGVTDVGAGETRRDAMAPVTLEVGDATVAVFAFTDKAPEYGASPSTPGVARVRADPAHAESRKCAREAIDRANEADPDVVLAALHVGTPMSTTPGEDTRAFAQWIAEEGVDVVYGHGADVFQGVEVYDGTPICYDCGTFVDDAAVDPDLHNDRSFLFEAVLDGDGVDRVRMIPVTVADGSVDPATGDTAEWCREAMRDRSGALSGSSRLERDGRALVMPVE